EPVERVHARAQRLQTVLSKTGGVDAVVTSSIARAGGGSLPQQDLPSFAVAISAGARSPDAIARALRAGKLPVLGRISKDQFFLDMRAVAEHEVAPLANAVADALTE
ncbi:MAG: L-seryl-tRNA(Sec) selenium transferase, partial [Pseudomonadota bacterium]